MNFPPLVVLVDRFPILTGGRLSEKPRFFNQVWFGLVSEHVCSRPTP
jgi:hypothetical protein